MSDSDAPDLPQAATNPNDAMPWYRQLNGYHWLVFIVCTLGWAFDCMDQHLFTAIRAQAVSELMQLHEADTNTTFYTTLATSIMMIGWATGGIIFGIIGDKYGRAKTMIFTILIYSLLTGLSAFSVTIYDFILIRFLAGVGIGGQFAVGASLVAETMPTGARPYVLGIMQACSAFGNISAALVAMTFNALKVREMLPLGNSDWRCIFLFGSLPAILAYFVIRYLREPESWKHSVAEAAGGVRKAGSIKEMFTDPRWRWNVIFGMLLASTGVIGLWGIGLFNVELSRSVSTKAAVASDEYKNVREEALRKYDMTEADLLHTRTDLAKGWGIDDATVREILRSRDLLRRHKITPEQYDSREQEILVKHSESGALKNSSEEMDDVRKRIQPVLDVQAASDRIISGVRGNWGAFSLLLFNIGAFFGMYSFTMVTAKLGRRLTFTIFLAGCFLSTAGFFLLMNSRATMLILVPIMGFFQLSMFGGYTIFFPELFPTRLRSTGVSFCYNVGRYVAACGPLLIGYLTRDVFGHLGASDPTLPLRYAGTTMCLFFILGIVVVWFLPETKGKPLPE